MPYIKALGLLLFGDSETWGIIGISLVFSFFSTLFAVIPSITLAFSLLKARSRIARASIAVLNALTAVPTVVIGLFVYSFISRSGPLGFLDLLYSPGGVILGQTLLAIPVVASYAYSGLSKLDPRFYETLTVIGTPKAKRFIMTVKEGSFQIATAVMTAFGRVTGEVGVSMMLGGNIRYHTRTMTTSIALDASKGDFERAIALGLVLLAISLAVNAMVHLAVKIER